MAPTLSVQLLGGFRICYGDAILDTLESLQAQTLLAYLILNEDVPQSYSTLLRILYPGAPASSDRADLHELVDLIRWALPQADRLIKITDQAIQWQPIVPVTVDVAEFKHALLAVETASTREVKVASARRAANVYHGDLLPDVSADWIVAERTQLRLAQTKNLEYLLQTLSDEQAFPEALEYAHRLRAHEPLQENAYFHLMRLQSIHGRQADALHTYHACATRLQEKLGSGPGTEMQDLYRSLISPAKTGPAPTVVKYAPLVGRHREWAILEQVWQRTTTGQPGMLLIRGPAGAGKTYLAEAMAQWATRRGFPTAIARLYPPLAQEPFACIKEWLGSPVMEKRWQDADDDWLAEVSRLLPEIRYRHPGLPEVDPMTEAWQRKRLFEAFGHLFLTGNRSMMLLLDDFHRCQPDTLDWLAYFLNLPNHLPVLLVATLDTDVAQENAPTEDFLASLRSAGALHEIELLELTTGAISAIAAHLSADEMSLQELSQLQIESEGIPLHVVESLLVAQDHQLDRSKAYPIQDLWAGRLSALSPVAQTVAEVAGVIGAPFTSALLLAAAQRSDVTQDLWTLMRAVDELWRRQFVRLVDDRVYDFRHDKLREAVLAGLTDDRKRLLHRHVAQALIQLHGDDLDAVSGRVAFHWRNAGALPQAFEFTIRAAEHAARLQAIHAAETSYRLVSQFAQQLPVDSSVLIRLYREWGRMLESKGDAQEAVRVYEQMLELARARGDRGAECSGIVCILAAHGESTSLPAQDSLDGLYEEGLALARQVNDQASQAHLLWLKAKNEARIGDLDQAIAQGAQCISLVRQLDLQECLAKVLHKMASFARSSGDQMQGLAYAAESRSLLERLGNYPLLADNLNQQALADTQQLAFPSALQHTNQAIQIGKDIGHYENISYAYWIQGKVRWAQGAWSQAQSAWEKCLTYSHEPNYSSTAVTALLDRGALLRELGDAQGAQQLHEHLHRFCKNQKSYLMSGVEAQLALDAFALRNLSSGKQWLDAALEHLPQERAEAIFYLIDIAAAAVTWAEQSGEWSTAMGIVEHIRRQRLVQQMPLHETILAYDLGRCFFGLGRTAEAKAHFREAIANAQDANMRAHLMKSHQALAAIYKLEGQWQQAKEHRQRAVMAAREIADNLDPETKQRFLAIQSIDRTLEF